MKKSLIALLIPVTFALTSCSFLENLFNKENQNVPEVEKEYTKNVVRYDGEEKSKDEFLAALPNRPTLSVEERGYNWVDSDYEKAIVDDKDYDREYGVWFGYDFYLKEFDGEYRWDMGGTSLVMNSEDKDKVDVSNDFLLAEAQEIVADRAKEVTKYYVGKETFAMVHHYKEEKGSTRYYYRFEIKWNKNGDILALNDFEASAIEQDDKSFVESIITHYHLVFTYKMTNASN